LNQRSIKYSWHEADLSVLNLWRLGIVSHKRGFKFTNKSQSEKAIMSTILGTISVASICIALFLTFRQKGIAEFRYGTAVFLTLLMSFVGIGLGIASRMEKDRFYFFSYLGISFNAIALMAISFLLYAGAYVD
ncbi:MAG: DUF6142 family protein, partial [Lachnospiraceae bacterium]